MGVAGISGGGLEPWEAGVGGVCGKGGSIEG